MVMSKIIKRGRLFVLLAIVFGVVLCDSAIAQKKPTKTKTLKKQKPSKRSPVSKTSIVLSRGVINGHVTKPEDLVKPLYRPAAKAAGASGSIAVEVLINEEGNVIKAVAVYGHLLLRPAAINAARKSKFTITTLSGNPVKVRGIIVYNFLPTSFNWLEIGYVLQSEGRDSIYSLKNLIEVLPYEFEAERQILEMITEESKDSILLLVRSMIESKLSDKPKEQWLFTLGIFLSKAQTNFEDETRQQLLQELRPLIQTAPENVKSILVERLQKLADLLESPALDEYDSVKGSKRRQALNEILDIMSFLGR